MSKICRMKRLLAIYQEAPVVRDSPDFPDLYFVPSYVKMQLRHFIANGIMELEVEILDELDNLVYKSDGIGSRSPLAIWVCLWVLILAYRGHLTFAHWHYFHVRVCK